MQRGIAIGIVIGWLFGVATLAGWVALSDGWYEYRVEPGTRAVQQAINEGWQPYQPIEVGGGLVTYLHRPRFRLP